MQVEPEQARRARRRSRAAPARTSPAASGSRGTSKARSRRPTPARRASSTSGARPSRPGTARRPSPTSRTSREQASAGPWPRGRTRARRRSAGASRSSGRRSTVFMRWRNSEYTVEIDDERRSGKMLEVIAAIGSELAGGMRLTPEADPSDGLFDVAADRRRHEGRLHADAAGDLPRDVPAAPPRRGRARQAGAGRDCDPAAHRPGRRAAGDDARDVRDRARRSPRPRVRPPRRPSRPSRSRGRVPPPTARPGAGDGVSAGVFFARDRVVALLAGVFAPALGLAVPSSLARRFSSLSMCLRMSLSSSEAATPAWLSARARRVVDLALRRHRPAERLGDALVLAQLLDELGESFLTALGQAAERAGLRRPASLLLGHKGPPRSFAVETIPGRPAG